MVCPIPIMKESIAELRSTIRRLRPCLLLSEETSLSSSQPQHHHQPTTTAAATNSGNDFAATAPPPPVNDEEKIKNHAIHELQKEAIVELVQSLASFVYHLDEFWAAEDNDNEDDDDDDENNSGTSIEATQVVGDRRQISTNTVTNEPESEWSEESKLLVREGYGLLLATATTNTNAFPHQSDDETDSMRSLVRNSILDLLPSLNTSPCRHFLLSFLPHFMPCASLSWNGSGCGLVQEDGRGSGWSQHIPSWLQEDGNDMYGYSSTCPNLPQDQQLTSNDANAELSSDNDNLVRKLLEVFQTLIQTDISTLTPMLANISTLFGQSNNTIEENGNNDDALQQQSGSDRRDGGAIKTTTSDKARSECFRLCLSSMSSVSEHDLPSLLNSLLLLVRNVEEGRSVMDTLRMEWLSICNTSNDVVVDYNRTVERGDEESNIVVANSNAQYHPQRNHGLVYIGDVVIQFILSEQMPGSKHVAHGFLLSLDGSLISETNEAEKHAQPSSTPLTSLDVIVMIALYSRQEYQHLVETIVDSMTHHQTMSFLESLHPLIQSWMPSDTSSMGQRRIERERTDSILYEPLASPLISILFYIMMTSSSTSFAGTRGEYLGSSSLMGGILLFCSTSTPFLPNATATETNTPSTCCRVLSELYLSVDPNRQESIINSLLSMVSDSFVFSSSFDMSSKKHRRRYQSNTATGRVVHHHQSILLVAARAACRTLLIISNRCGMTTTSIRGTVMDRLLLLASKSVLKTNTPGKLGADNCATVYYHLFDMNCALAVSLLHASGEVTQGGGNEASELLILCQKLLFSSNLVSTAMSNSSNSYQHRAICGIILASRLLRCKLIPSVERGNIWSWIITVISPSPSAATPLEALGPEIARWGLTLLQFASSVMPTEASTFTTADSINIRGTKFPELDRFVETQPVCGQGDVFNQVNKMLATAGIIQWEDSLKVPLFLKESRSVTPHTFLAFTDVSIYDQLSKQKSPTSTCMVICGPHFLHGQLSQLEWLQKSIANQNNPFLESIDMVADYVYHLIDRYLELGKLKSASWNPRGWLVAKTQLPCCLSESTMEILGFKRHYGLELYGRPEELADDGACHRGVNDDDFHKQWRLLFADETKSKVTIVQNLVEFVNSLIISISVNAASLKHAHQHFQRGEMYISSQSVPDSNTRDNKSIQRRKRKQVEALRKLLQFQVSKILTMQKICKNIHLALSGLHSEVCKFNSIRGTNQGVPGIQPTNNSTSHNPPTENTDIDSAQRCEEKATYQRKRIPLSDLKSIISAIEIFMSSKVNNIDDTILWNCLDDDVDDEALVKEIRNYKPSENAPEGNSAHSSRASMIRRLRNCILQCLLQNILQRNITSSSARCMLHSEGNHHQTGISRLFRLTVSLLDVYFASNGAQGNDIRVLLSMHYKLLLAVFSITTINIPTNSAIQDNIYRPERSKRRLTACSSSSSSSNSNSSWFTDIIQSCAYLTGANFNITTAKKEGSSSPTHSNSTEILMLIFSRHLNDCKDATISCHIIDLISILLINSEWSCGTLAKITQGALYSVYTMSAGKAQNPPYALIKLNSILIEASIDKEGCNDSSRASFVNEAFTNLIQSTKALLTAKDSFTSAFVHHILSYWSALILDGTSQINFHTDTVEALEMLLNRRTTHCINSSPRKKPSFAGLNEKSHASLFELILHMINASLSLSKPHRVKKQRTSTDNLADTSPYGEVIGFVKVYGRLLLMFQTNRIHFPRRFVRTIVRSSSQMIRISNYQLRQCVEWRNSQPSQIGIGMDSAAVELLQPLVDSVASHCIGSIISFCNSMKGQQHGRKRSFDSSYKNTRAFAGLLYRCEGIKETLQGICQSQNLIFPKDFTPSNDTTVMNQSMYVDNSVAKKIQRINKELSPRRTIRSRGSIDKALKSPSVLELLPESDVTMKMLDDSIALQSNLQSDDSEDSELKNVDSDDDSMQVSDDDNDDDDSFGVIGNWGAN